jgi:hypothetical protein
LLKDAIQSEQDNEGEPEGAEDAFDATRSEPDNWDDIQRWHRQATESAKILHVFFLRMLDMYMGDNDSGMSSGASSSVENPSSPNLLKINAARTVIENLVPYVTRSRMTWVARALDPASEANQDACAKALRAHWDREDVDDKVEQAVRHSGIFGAGFLKNYWDRESGHVHMEVFSPFNVYPDTTSTRFEDMRYMFLLYEIGKPDFERRYPWADVDECEMAGPKDDPSQAMSVQTVQTAIIDRTELVRIWECYSDGGQKVCTFSNDTILYNGPNTSGNLQWPVRMIAGTHTGLKWWPVSELSQLQGLQYALDVAATRISNGLAHQMNQSWFATAESGLTEMPAEAGQVIQVKQLDQAQPIEPIPLSADTYRWMDTVVNYIQFVSGIQTSLQGVREKGLTSGIAQSTVMEAAQVRVNLILQHVVKVMRDIGRQTLALYQTFCEDEERVILGQDVVEAGRSAFQGTFDVTVEQQGELGRSPMALLEAGIRFLEIGAFSNPAARYVFEAVDWPGWRTWLTDLEAQVAQQQAAANQQGLEQALLQSLQQFMQAMGASPGHQVPPQMLTTLHDLAVKLLQGENEKQMKASGGAPLPGAEGDHPPQQGMNVPRVPAPGVLGAITPYGAGQTNYGPRGVGQLNEEMPVGG